MGKSTFLQEFKAFAMKGNVVDMAVGVIIGGAFGKIVSSVVADLLMPLIALIGGVNTSDLKLVLRDAVKEGDKVVKEAVTWNYGAFVQNVVDFLIIAMCLFCIIKLIAKLSDLTKKEKESEPEPAPAPEPAPTKEEILLTEIRDLLKEKK
ncbi:MAG: large-conductance mechanosensitive channel protein MscL [Bacteroidales bacterium]|nr:large-conductance mechanosensitive channel protein MscL [Bacteroidales bacterium]